jgi:glycine hydroxymethyltransferase
VEFARIGEMIAEVVDGMVRVGEGGDDVVEAQVRAEVRDLTGRFPIYI